MSNTLPTPTKKNGDGRPTVTYAPHVHDPGAPVPMRLDTARQVANTIRSVIEQQKLSVNIQGKEYVRCEGWTALGALMGLMPREVSVRRVDDPRGYEAVVEVVRVSDGTVLSRASAICTRDEPHWRQRPEYAIRSMAVTRATAKAFRLVYSWVMALAGYQPTPAEEMDEVIDVQPHSGSSTGKPVGQRSGDSAKQQQANAQRKPSMTPAQRNLADVIIRKVSQAYPHKNPRSEEFKELCRELLDRVAGFRQVQDVPDDIAEETVKTIADWSPDVVKLQIEVPF